MEIVANAKINLCLDVVKKLDTGYHEMNMIMVPLALHDVVSVNKAKEDELICTKGTMPLDESNSMWKALQLMRKTFAFTQGFHLSVEKNIPMEAGMAGGSADAAAVMKGIWESLRKPCSLEELALLGKAIGADIPFCIMNTCSIVQGIGEQVTPFQSACHFDVLLVKPTQGVPTKQAFSTLDFSTCVHPHTMLCKEALMCGDIQSFYTYAGNTLEQSAFEIVSEIAHIKQTLQTLGFPFVLMSGSGSTVFALCQDKQLLEKGYDALQGVYPFVVKTSTLSK